MNKAKVECPYCGYKMPERYEVGDKKANCEGVAVKCKNRDCRKEFEIKIEQGHQSK